MARVEKNAAGEGVRVDTPDYGCFTIDPAADAAPAKIKTKAKTVADGAAETEGEI